MNIFYLDRNPYKASKMLMDVHLRKLLVETAQLLCTHDILCGKERPLKPTHRNHPCRVCLSEEDNYKWLVTYMRGMLNEYYHRFHKFHAYESLWNRFYANDMLDVSRHSEYRSFPQCMPDEWKRDDTVEAYRLYYRWKKFDFSMRNISTKYTNREKPEWL